MTHSLLGYQLTNGQLTCDYCGAHLTTREAFATHLKTQHGGALTALLAAGGLTATQQRVLAAVAKGQTDREIAEATGVSGSTIRQQKFRFRQKAAAARLYLAQYEAVFGPADSTVELLPVPTAASAFNLTTASYERALHQYVDWHGTHPRLSHWPKKEAARVALCARIVEDFAFTQHYDRAAIKQCLSQWYPDHSVLTRYLIDYGYLARTADGRDYWRIF
ncbi:MAG: DUF2087 domain-containing protein [Lactobacillus sp.]|jgi:DNA-binding CsgD family transcriptional regulator|nr:DUF2087 domain-containing protein [Lactobacillus sp.]MCI2032824.1 DUF2087 domain-containing protein [Lactobacillus sp.]